MIAIDNDPTIINFIVPPSFPLKIVWSPFVSVLDRYIELEHDGFKLIVFT